MNQQLITIAEASTLVRLAPETIRRMALAGEIISYRHGPRGHFRIEKNSLLAALTRTVPKEPAGRFDLKALGQQILADMRQHKTMH